jgi:3-oxocholest-4-en-26-oyl-CoA dehydrogenase alpha subunit
MITTQLNHERVGLSALGGRCWQLWGEVGEWALNTPLPGADDDDGQVSDVPWVRADLARSFR